VDNLLRTAVDIGDGPRIGGVCARAVSNPASGGEPGQAARYIGALHGLLWHVRHPITTANSRFPRSRRWPAPNACSLSTTPTRVP